MLTLVEGLCAELVPFPLKIVALDPQIGSMIENNGPKFSDPHSTKKADLYLKIRNKW